MAMLCYSLDEAAQKLDMSETVLLRLSQFLKVPAKAYDELGSYVSFEGDLSFSDQDIVFFKQVKERLLAGESLESVRQRIQPEYQRSAVSVQSEPLRIEPQLPASSSHAASAEVVEAEESFVEAFDSHSEPESMLDAEPTQPQPVQINAGIDTDLSEELTGYQQAPSQKLPEFQAILKPLKKLVQHKVQPKTLEMPAEAIEQQAETDLKRYKKRQGYGKKPVFEKLAALGRSAQTEPETTFASSEAGEPQAGTLAQTSYQAPAHTPTGSALRQPKPIAVSGTELVSGYESESEAAGFDPDSPWQSVLYSASQSKRLLSATLKMAAVRLKEQSIANHKRYY